MSLIETRTAQLSRRSLLRGAAVIVGGAAAATLPGVTAHAASKKLDYTFHSQETGWSCSAGSSKIALSAHGINPPESELRDALHLNGGGLASIDYLVNVMNRYTGTNYHQLRQWSNADYAGRLDADVRHNVDRGYGLLINVWYYNSGHNNPVRTSSGHYLTIMGYSDDSYWIADPASYRNGPGFWASKSTLVGWRKHNRYVAGVNINGSPTPPPTQPPTDGWTTLKNGSTGFRVGSLQHLLRSRGSSIAADGHFGAQTERAVKSFQSRNALLDDGIVGAKTWPKVIIRVTKGSTGSAAKAAQVALNGHGAKLVVDGQFGARSVEAAKAFQRAKKIEIDGLVGPQTWEALI
ncbi:peptidoglycan-binding protein [Microlunatus sp. Y2014]|uniref:peptidoglycan-binding protein n=1 Tax=Microlunatus sp. Y2014 TaxID=3418488 RepID=UPI003DA74ECB